MASTQDIHITMSSCSLCRQAPTAGTTILDLGQAPFLVTVCKSPCSLCFHKPYPRVWFHALCYDILMISYEPSEKPTFEELGKFADARRPSYECQDKTRGEIASILEGLSSEYTRRIIQSAFRQDLFTRFPMEIRIMISKLIAPCWYLNVLGESRRLIEQLRSDHQPQCMQLKLTQDVWALRTSYRGISYVARLSSRPLEATASSRVYHMSIPDKFGKIVVSLDSIGLRQIQFLDNDSKPKTDGSPWYQILERKGPSREIKVSSDGLFVRGIELVSNGSSSTKRLWSSPFPPKFHPWNIYHVREKPRLDYLRLDSHVKGLLVCCANAKMVGIHGFSDTSTTFREFVSLMRQRTSKSYRKWIYFPLSQQEFIKAAWIRKFKICRGLASNPVLVLQTSFGRTVTFGPQFPIRIIDQYEYIPLVKESDGPISGVFHDGLDPDSDYVLEVGVTFSHPCQGGALDLLPMDAHLEPPAVPPGRGSIATTWYMTKASLNGLVQVQVSRAQDQPHQPISGLLLFFSDEHIESLGQVRWEYNLSQEILMPIYVKKGTIGGQDYIKDIRSDKNDPGIDVETGEWQKLPSTGIVVWWFSNFGDKITTYDE